VVRWEAVVLAHLVHDLVQFCMALMVYLDLFAFLFLSIGHELASTLMILLCR
jgi:hypothetical protein